MTDLLVDKAEVWPEPLAVVKVAQRVAREITSRQHQRAFR